MTGVGGAANGVQRFVMAGLGPAIHVLLTDMT
jgi:hypothetical protein